METRQIVLVDTNILIEIYKNNELVKKNIENLQSRGIAISIVSASELVYGAKDKNELRLWMKSIEELVVFKIDEEISQKAFDLMHRFSLSHNLDFPDALIAATALLKNIELYTLNLKHFRYIPDLKLYEPVH